MPKSHGMLVAAYTAGQRHAICNQHDAATLVFGPGGSAAGPKPGRIGFSDELARFLLQAGFAQTLKSVKPTRLRCGVFTLRSDGQGPPRRADLQIRSAHF